MTNDEARNNDEIRMTKKPPTLSSLSHSSFLRRSTFVLRHSYGLLVVASAKLLFSSLALGRGFLRVGHYTFEGVNRAQHLRVARTNLRFLVPDFGVAVARKEKGVLLFSRHWHCNIRRDSVAVDNLLTRGVVLGGGKT